jgi:rhamnogalacturonan endolyase
VRTTDSSGIRIFTSTEVTDRTLHLLMHDTQYRVEVPQQNTAHNQPAYTGFYRASDTDSTKVPLRTVEVEPPAAKFRDTRNNDSYTIPATVGVQYVVDGTVKKAGGDHVHRAETVYVTTIPLEWVRHRGRSAVDVGAHLYGA